MAHYITLRRSDDGATTHVHGFAYSAVPGGNNGAGVPWTEVAIGYMTWRNRRYQGGTLAAIPVEQAIQDALNTGTLFEWRFDVQFPTSHTNPQALAAIAAGVNAQEAAMLAELGIILRYWGHEADSV